MCGGGKGGRYDGKVEFKNQFLLSFSPSVFFYLQAESAQVSQHGFQMHLQPALFLLDTQKLVAATQMFPFT